VTPDKPTLTRERLAVLTANGLQVWWLVRCPSCGSLVLDAHAEEHAKSHEVRA
jgi:hypothetical protein